MCVWCLELEHSAVFNNSAQYNGGLWVYNRWIHVGVTGQQLTRQSKLLLIIHNDRAFCSPVRRRLSPHCQSAMTASSHIPAGWYFIHTTLSSPAAVLSSSSSSAGELFAQAPIDEYPGIAVETVSDSSRYFVLRIQDDSGMCSKTKMLFFFTFVVLRLGGGRIGCWYCGMTVVQLTWCVLPVLNYAAYSKVPTVKWSQASRQTECLLAHCIINDYSSSCYY